MERKDSRQKVLYVGPPGCGTLERVRLVVAATGHWRGREAEQGFAYRAAGMPALGASTFSPLRAPHHTVSAAQMEGKLRGHIWRPGEVHLAHGGVLHLELVPEFRMDVLEGVARAWRQGYTHQASRTAEGVLGDAAQELNHLYVPTYFTLTMSMTPCPCGWRGVEGRSCACTERAIERWFDRAKVVTEGTERIDLEYKRRGTPLPVEETPASPAEGEAT